MRPSIERREQLKTICVIGTGYVGLVTGACLADMGNQVTCVDIIPEKIEKLQAGVLPIYEPGLAELVERNVQAGRLHFTTSYPEGLAGAEFIFIAVGTPTGQDGQGADLRYVESAARSIAEELDHYAIVINKSTVPVGTGDVVANLIRQNLKRPDVRFSVVSNPEFLREGAAVQDFFQPDRVVLGSTEPDAALMVSQLYVPLRAPVMVTDIYTAEMIKYASNAFLATKISFINEIARICERLGADVKEVAAGMGYDKRIGRPMLDAGLGYGGSCFSGDESVFALNSPNVATERFDALFAKGAKDSALFRGDVVELVQPAGQRVLAFDLETGQPTLADVKAMTRRPYKGTMVTINTSMGRTLRVTADHPVVLYKDAQFAIWPAAAVAPGDQLMALTELPAVEQAAPLNLIELLKGTALEQDVYVAPTDNSFSDQYAQFSAAIPATMLKRPEEIRQHNRMSLRLFRHLSAAGVLAVPAEKLQLYTLKGGGARVNAVIPVDADLLRFCGYYLAEGYLYQDVGGAGAVRERVVLSFHENEAEYIADVQRILSRWGLKFIERHATSALTTLVSSRVLAWLLHDVLRIGTRSEDKALPRLAFNVAPELRRELIRGAFSGDGSVTLVQNGQNLMLEYATVSKTLADGLALLLQTVGVVPSIHLRLMNKSKQVAYILRVSGSEQIAALKDAFGEKRRAQIEEVLAGYQRHIRQRGFERHGPFATLTVRDVQREEVETTVYSMETSTGTLIASSGLISHNCFPKDVKALAHMGAEAGLHPQLLNAVMEINQDQRRLVVDKLVSLLGGLRGAVIGILGLAFKPNTDDMREAASIDIIRWLLAQGAEVRAYDPVATETAQQALAGLPVIYCKTSYEVAEGADAVVVVTEWNEFKSLNMQRIRDSMRQPVLIDGRNIYEPAEMQRLGFTYRGMGRASGNALLGLSNGQSANGAAAESPVSAAVPNASSASRF
jgi:UDPglucose 6-dehydrogenase